MSTEVEAAVLENKVFIDDQLIVSHNLNTKSDDDPEIILVQMIIDNDDDHDRMTREVVQLLSTLIAHMRDSNPEDPSSMEAAVDAAFEILVDMTKTNRITLNHVDDKVLVVLNLNPDIKIHGAHALRDEMEVVH
jgi:hypothetical protein